MKVLDKQEKLDFYGASKNTDAAYLAKWYEVIELDDCHIEWPVPHVQSEFWYDDESDSPLTDDERQRRHYFIWQNMSDADIWNVCKWQAMMNEREYTGEDYNFHVQHKLLPKPYITAYKDYNGQVFARPVFFGHVFSIAVEDAKCDGYVPELCRELTEQEVTFICASAEQFLAKFMKRLETYWKRYSDKVTAHGYWRNR